MDHQHRFAGAVARYQTYSVDEIPADWLAMLYLLTAHETVWGHVKPHIDFRARRADLRRPQFGVLSSGEKAVIRLAANLFFGEGLVDMFDLCSLVDDDVLEAANQALWIRRKGWDWIIAMREVDLDPIPF